MSDKQKFPLVDAMKVACEIVDRLKPACERICIAGSIRRQKPEVSDIEILFIPKLDTRPDGLFDSVAVNLAAEAINKDVESGYFAKRPSVTGSFSWGESNKLAIHTASGIPVDLFATDVARWFVALTIRTGSKDTNLALTMGANKKNASLMAYGAGVKWRDGTVTQAASERHVFEMCGVPYREPKDR